MAEYLNDLNYKGKVYQYIDLEKASDLLGGNIEGLPYSIRILLESVLRKEDGIDVTKDNIISLMHYQAKSPRGEVPFKPSRVILQDFTGVPVVVDLASMRDAIVGQGGRANQINPEIPVD